VAEDQAQRATELIWQGRVPVGELLGDVFTVDQAGEALDLLARRIPGRGAVRVGLRLT
jgi:hypothetical protein